MLVACGPFTADTDTSYKPWRALLQHIKVQKPDVLLLVRIPSNSHDVPHYTYTFRLALSSMRHTPKLKLEIWMFRLPIFFGLTLAIRSVHSLPPPLAVLCSLCPACATLPVTTLLFLNLNLTQTCSASTQYVFVFVVAYVDLN